MSTDALKWVFPVYYTISGYWALSGIVYIIGGLGALKGFGPCDVVSGAISLILGIGLIMRFEFIRGVVNVACFVKILGAIWGAWQGFLLFPILGGLAAIGLIFSVIDFVTGAFMIFLIGETDKAAPNI